MIWKPHVTVAALLQREDKFLLVEEWQGNRLVLNQPAGHLEDRESLLSAVVRETIEETGWTFSPEYITGLYRWREPRSGRTYLRVCFTGTLLEHDPDIQLDEGIERALWLDHQELLARPERLRSPLVMRCIDDFLGGRRYPLELLGDIE